jgi:hypothetical protein
MLILSDHRESKDSSSAPYAVRLYEKLRFRTIKSFMGGGTYPVPLIRTAIL